MQKKLIIAMVLVTALAVAARAADEKAKPASDAANLRFTVLKDSNGKPVRNASVILHAVNKNGKQDKGGLQLKTNAEGEAVLEGVPYGKLRVQVLASGFQTYGEDFEINQPEKEFVIKLKRPSDQYSIYNK
jgi:carboxypeptidase family protein